MVLGLVGIRAVRPDFAVHLQVDGTDRAGLAWPHPGGELQLHDGCKRGREEGENGAGVSLGHRLDWGGFPGCCPFLLQPGDGLEAVIDRGLYW